MTQKNRTVPELNVSFDAILQMGSLSPEGTCNLPRTALVGLERLLLPTPYPGAMGLGGEKVRFCQKHPHGAFTLGQVLVKS